MKTPYYGKVSEKEARWLLKQWHKDWPEVSAYFCRIYLSEAICEPLLGWLRL